MNDPAPRSFAPHLTRCRSPRRNCRVDRDVPCIEHAGQGGISMLRAHRLLGSAIGASLLLTATIVIAPVQRTVAAGGLASPKPWPTVVPQEKQGARAVLREFSQAVLQGRATVGKHYLAPDFRGRCGAGTRASQPLSVILCGMPRPMAYQIFSIENGDRAGRLLTAVVIYRLKNRHRQLMLFDLRRTSAGWRIASIGLPQG